MQAAGLSPGCPCDACSALLFPATHDTCGRTSFLSSTKYLPLALVHKVRGDLQLSDIQAGSWRHALCTQPLQPAAPKGRQAPRGTHSGSALRVQGAEGRAGQTPQVRCTGWDAHITSVNGCKETKETPPAVRPEAMLLKPNDRQTATRWRRNPCAVRRVPSCRREELL